MVYIVIQLQNNIWSIQYTIYGFGLYKRSIMRNDMEDET